jgi:DNA-binding response OmpR family regulator
MSSTIQKTSDGPEVLVVEDDADAAAVLSMSLKRRGCRVREAHSLADAQTMMDPPPDWMVLDLTLPDGDGLALMHEVRERALRTRVAVVTGSSDPIRLWEATRLNAAMVVRKPVDPTEVVRRIAC